MDFDESFSSEESVDSDEEVNMFCMNSTTREPNKIHKLWKTHLAQQIAVWGFITFGIFFTVTRSICSWKVKARVES